MENATRDQNSIPTALARSSSDGKPLRLRAHVGLLMVSDGSSGSDLGDVSAARDENYVTTLMATSSADGKTPVPLYCTSGGILLIKST